MSHVKEELPRGVRKTLGRRRAPGCGAVHRRKQEAGSSHGDDRPAGNGWWRVGMGLDPWQKPKLLFCYIFLSHLSSPHSHFSKSYSIAPRHPRKIPHISTTHKMISLIQTALVQMTLSLLSCRPPGGPSTRARPATGVTAPEGLECPVHPYRHVHGI